MIMVNVFIVIWKAAAEKRERRRFISNVKTLQFDNNYMDYKYFRQKNSTIIYIILEMNYTYNKSHVNIYESVERWNVVIFITTHLRHCVIYIEIVCKINLIQKKCKLASEQSPALDKRIRNEHFGLFCFISAAVIR